MKKMVVMFAALLMSFSVVSCKSAMEASCDDSFECAKDACKSDSCKKDAEKARDACISSADKLHDEKDCKDCAKAMDDFADCQSEKAKCKDGNMDISMDDAAACMKSVGDKCNKEKCAKILTGN